MLQFVPAKGRRRQTKRKEGENVEGPEQKKFKPERIEPIEEFKTVELVAHRPDKVTRIGSGMSKTVETLMIEFLKENVDMFPSSPSDFKGIDPEVIVHRLNVDSTTRHVKQKKRSFRAEWNRIIEEEVKKLLEAGATYQRLLNRMFKKQIGSTMEVHIDDMLVKSKEGDHLKELRRAFEIMRAYGMKLNPSKCTFGVQGGKFLGYMVSEKVIEANPEKIQAIIGLRSPRTLNEMQKFTGKITSLSRFISRSADRSLLFFKAFGKAKEFKWTEECEQALDNLKQYLATPLLSANHKLGEVLFLYLAVSEEAVSSVLVREQEKNQNPVYYGRTAIKAQALADFIVEFTREQGQDERWGWLLHVDGSSNASNGGTGVLLQEPDGVEIEVAARLSFPAINNEVEYEALVLGFQLALEAGIKEINVCTDTQLVAMQIKRSYETRERTMVQYLGKVKELMARFDKCIVQQIP
ncbi:UNVERIFIED_CONTAM: hypothetical protein Sradi_0189800 [Sesamum radiatum]|uniref:RNase H type-1 domain-containing protein n=1 Tax=Sesamum radiatum TaxID=300843 RepID=A0AAW2W0S3_SESRA